MSKNAEKLDEKILDTLRGSMGGNEFTYAPVGADEFVCMSSVPADGGSVLQGTVVGIKGKLDAMPEKPSCYVGKWGRYDLLSGDDIPEGEIPAPDTDVDYDYFPAQLGQILDAVMFGSKKVAILVESNDEAMDCIKAINYMLPPAYAKHIGYSVGASKIPDTNLSVITDTGRTLPIGVKVFFTSADKVNTAAQGYYVFDINPEDPTNNYKAELSEFAKVVDDFCMESKGHMDKMAKHIAVAFDADGNLDRDMLKRLSLLFRFVLTPDDATAEGLVDAGMGNGTDKTQKNAFLAASRHFWGHSDPTALPEGKRQNMVTAYNSEMGTFSEEDSVAYFRYLINQVSLTEGEKAVLMSIAVERDCLSEDSDALFSNPDFGVRNTVFEVLTGMLRKNSNIYSCEELIKGAIEYFNINNCYAVLTGTGEFESGEELFSMAGKLEDKDLKVLLPAILMASCFTTTASAYSPHTPIRFRGLRRMMTEAKMTPLEELACVVKVHRRMGDIANLGDFEMNDISYFLCDRGTTGIEPEWTQWIRERVDKLSITQLLDMENVLINSDYIGLKTVVEGKLLDIEFVAPKLRANKEIRPEYTRIFNMINNDNQYRQIAEYLRKLKNEELVESRFLEVRWTFLKEAYETLSDSDRRRIGEMSPDANDYRVDKRNDIAERVQAEFRTSGSRGKGGFLSRILPIANMALWAVVALLGMWILNGALSKGIMAEHSTLITRYMILPVLTATCSALFYHYNAGRNLLLRNIITAIETVVFLVAMLVAYYGSIALIGIIL